MEYSIEPMYDPMYAEITKDNSPQFENYRRTFSEHYSENPYHDKHHVPEMYRIAEEVFEKRLGRFMEELRFKVEVAVSAIVGKGNQILLGKDTVKVATDAVMDEIEQYFKKHKLYL